MHYILVSGGVISGVGKGIIASSTGLLLQRLGFRVSYIKIDPYVSVDAGLMSPSEHGECYVTASGHECDLDVGSVERYLSLTLTGDNNITTGKIYLNVINKERKGDYLGKTVQIVPHVVNAIKDWIKRVAVVPLDGSGEEPDVCIIELGGTVGDIESMPFVEALTQLRHEVGQKNFANIMVSYVPTIHGEQKTKPTQHAVKSIRSSGLIPDVIACRCRKPLMDETVRKIALHCQAEQRQVIVVRDMPSIYQVPILLEEQQLLPILLTQLSLEPSSIPQSRISQGTLIWDSWKSLALTAHESTVRIALVGKYVKTPDAYMSLVKSLEHAAMHLHHDLDLVWIDAEHLDPAMERAEPETWSKTWETLKSASGVIIPGGFGERGVESKMLASKWARENKVPFLGVCLGFQVAVMQYARDHCDMPVANSEEFNANTPEPVVVYMPDLDRKNMGGTMRLGAHKTYFQPGSEWSKLRTLYGGSEIIEERHRHRYEVNPKMVDLLKEKGMEFIGKDETGQRMEIFELKDHPFFVGTQFHAEYQTRVLEPSKPYLGFVAASAGVLDQVLKEAKKLPNGKA